MKRLTLLRHAKSSWGDAARRDFDRPLNARGRRAAQTMGREMRRLCLGFDAVIASPATRVVETLEHVAAGYGASLDPAFDPSIYMASPETLLDRTRAADDTASRLLLVGHNPSLHALTLALAAPGPLRDQAAIKYPTAALAEIALACESWRDVGEASGTLARFIRPRDLDPELGPEL